MSEKLTNAEVEEILKGSHDFCEHQTYTGPGCAQCGRPKHEHRQRRLARALLEDRAALKALHDSAHMLDFQHCRDPKCEAAERIRGWEEK